jgi:hypothetical protein
MKYVKMLGLLAVAAAALMAFVGTASADTLTSAAGTTPTLKATSANATLHNAVGTIECESEVEGPVTGHGAKAPVSGTIEKLTFGANKACVGGSVHNNTITGGTLSLEVTGTNTGILFSSGATVMVTMAGIACGYRTEATPIGTVTGGEHAVLHISATIKRTEGSFFCGDTGTWTGGYKVNSPTNIHLDNN